MARRGEAARRAGALGEDYAAARLEQEGYRLLWRNLRTPYGELDLVAVKGELLAIVEVKTRVGSGWSRPAEAVGLRKQRRLTAAALWLLAEEGETLSAFWPRFDVFEVVTAPGERFSVVQSRHLEGAFVLTEQNRPG